MPASTPEAAGHTAPDDAMFVTQVVAESLRAYRHLRRLDQERVAGRMRWLGHVWQRNTVSEVERARRNVTLQEAVGLCLVLSVSLGELMDPRGPAGRGPSPRVVLTNRRVEISGEGDEMLTQLSVFGTDGWLTIDGGDLAALVCSHHSYAEVVWERDADGLREIAFHEAPDPPAASS